MHHLLRDVRYSLRTLIRVPALWIAIIVTIGIGLGATTAMVSVVRAVLVSGLPYADSEALVWIYTDNPPYRFSLSVVDYRALEADHPAFRAVAAYQTSLVTVTGNGTSERVRAKAVTGSYFPLLGQRPHVGRLFDVTDDTRNDAVAVLTYAYWQKRFGRDPSVVDRMVTVDGARYTIVGVLQRSVGPLEHDVALFTAARWPAPRRKGPFFTTVLARLRPDVSRSAAVEALRATNARLFPIWKSSYQDEKATWGMLDLKERVIGDVRSTLVFMLAAVGCVLLIACANAINLLVARALNRTRELAIRRALGASRGRLVQQLLVEAAVLTAGAAAVGLAIAATAIKLITAYAGSYLPRIDEVRLGGPELEWLGILALASAMLIGLIPAIQSSRVRISGALASGGRSGTDAPGAQHTRRALVAAEFALATPLVVAALVVLTSLQHLTRIEVGIDTERVLTAAVSLPAARYARDEDREAFWKRAVARLSALPGVESAAVADSRPPNESGQRNNFDLEDRPTPHGQNQPICTWVGASPGFFKTVGLRLVRGRLLDDHSLRDDTVVVDRAWANRFFPGEEVLGRRFHNGGCTTCPWTTVIGVVDDVKWIGLDAAADGTVYFPLVDLSNAFFMLRTTDDPSSLVTALRRAVQELDPELALSEVATGSELVSEELSKPRYISVLIGLFALTALVLSIVGIYGVMAYFVQQHARDIGIRLALGGDPGRVRRMILLHGVRLVAIGVGMGIAMAFISSRLLTTMVFGVSPTDPRTMVAVPIVLLAIGILACLVPAHRAASVDPADVLREG